MSDRIVKLPRPKDKYGNSKSDFELVVPEMVKDGSIASLIIKNRKADPSLSNADSALRYLMNLIDSQMSGNYLSSLLDSPNSLRLSDFINLRIKLYKQVEAGELKKSHINYIVSSLSKLDVTLACGLKIRDWGKFRSAKEKNLSRQITDKEIIWDEIKGVQSLTEVGDKTQSYLTKQYDDYEQAALRVIGDYQSLCKVTQSIADNYRMGIITRTEAEGKVFYQIKKIGLSSRRDWSG